MPERAPRPTPAMRLVRTRAIATTYELIVPTPLGGYALCTVNDGTGELLITSDWDNWSHQWSPRPSVLAAASLTAFIGERSDIDYIARKLQGGSGRLGRQFSPLLTAMALKRDVARLRLEDGRSAIEHLRELEDDLEYERGNGADPDSTFALAMDIAALKADLVLEPRGLGRHERYPLSKSAARGLCDDIDELAEDMVPISSPSTGDVFFERLNSVLDHHDAHAHLPEPWESRQDEQTYSDRVLRESILPALIAACRQTTLGRMLVAANGPQPAIETEAA